MNQQRRASVLNRVFLPFLLGLDRGAPTGAGQGEVANYISSTGGAMTLRRPSAAFCSLLVVAMVRGPAMPSILGVDRPTLNDGVGQLHGANA